MDLVLRRRYRSQVHYHGKLGWNWDFDWNESLFWETASSVIQRQNGRARIDYWTAEGGGVFRPSEGNYGTLIQTRDEDDTLVFVLRERGRLLAGTLFLDRDVTANVRAAHGGYITDPADVVLRPAQQRGYACTAAASPATQTRTRQRGESTGPYVSGNHNCTPCRRSAGASWASY